ncbi:hypothetical protein [Kluyvera sichuanensis]|uniref:hypothetical protein n=1 Tax=Kluyvera sichuanensis TaxID=2725494 RepID=UPI0034A1F361
MARKNGSQRGIALALLISDIYKSIDYYLIIKMLMTLEEAGAKIQMDHANKDHKFEIY